MVHQDMLTSPPANSKSFRSKDNVTNVKDIKRRSIHRIGGRDSSPDSSHANHSAGNTSTPKPSDRRSQHKFHKLFNLDHNEPLVKSFPCALVGEILFQGTFYSSEHFFCFHSKFAKKRKLIQIAIREVTNLTREKTAGIIPNAIALHTKHSRFVFASIIGRENIFRLLTNLWETQLSVSNTLKWVSNDGVIHDSSVDTELDTEEDDDADEDVTVQVNCLDGTPRNNGLATSRNTAAATAVASNTTAVPTTNAISKTSPSGVTSPDPSPSGESNPSKSVCRRKNIISDVPDTNSTHSNAVTFPISQSLRDLWGLPRIQLCLFIAYIILIFLAFSAIVLAWRVHTYQAFLQDRIDQLDHTHSVFEPFCHTDDAQCNLYRLRQQTHTSRIRHVQSVMNSNIRTLNDLARRLRVPEPAQATVAAATSPLSDKSEPKSRSVPAT